MFKETRATPKHRQTDFLKTTLQLDYWLIFILSSQTHLSSFPKLCLLFGRKIKGI